MSEEIELNLSGAEWWYFFGAFAAWCAPGKYVTDYRSDGSLYAFGVSLAAPGMPILGEIHFSTQRNKTQIRMISRDAEYADFWKDGAQFLRTMAERAEMRRREALGMTFERILDDYYAAKDRGESP